MRLSILVLTVLAAFAAASPLDVDKSPKTADVGTKTATHISATHIATEVNIKSTHTTKKSHTKTKTKTKTKTRSYTHTPRHTVSDKNVKETHITTHSDIDVDVKSTTTKDVTKDTKAADKDPK
ncbi:hypothetical protein G7Y89_g4132 [Cudoniella acicularis]|uniref:Uncharacterized protein n=1 Tax=Cudoniella acicularis TaxID=354080 RepID=A0A8H4RT18_9HELO|nr:hypothetical protein G7Y89_g4132 [Cudoniella acicularis]